MEVTESSAMQKIVPLNTSVDLSSRNGRELKIGAILTSRGLLTSAQVQSILAAQEGTDRRFGEIAVRKGLVKQKDVDEALRLQFGYSTDVTAEVKLPPELIAANNASSPFVEALRGLRGQLMLRWFDGTPGQSALAITSVDRGDGKSFIIANLSIVFAQLGEQTLVVDGDLRHPTQHKIFNIRNQMGLSGILSGRANLDEIKPIPGIPNLSVLPAGPLPPNPQELLGRPQFGELLDLFSSRYNVILVDTPSAQEAADAHVVAQRTRAVIIVGRKDKTRSSELAQLAGIFSGSGVQILGATLNSI
jgi:protein-tyrosine kinase